MSAQLSTEKATRPPCINTALGTKRYVGGLSRPWARERHQEWVDLAGLGSPARKTLSIQAPGFL